MNKQITESYVSFEIAQLLKEKGFDEYCLFCYEQNVFSHTTNLTLKKALYRDILIGIKNSEFEENAIHNVFTAPSQSLALKWLREEHRIETHIVLSELSADNSRKYMFDIYSSDINRDFDSVQKEGFNSYEQAVEAALKYTLENLI